MSSQFDVFDNLNDYLNQNDDCDFPDEDLEDINNEEHGLEEIASPVMKTSERKSAGKKQEIIPPKKTRRRVTKAKVDSSDEDDLVISPTSSSSVDLVGDEIDEKFEEVQTLYELIFHKSPLLQEGGKYFTNLQKRFQTLLKQKRSGRRNKVFMSNLEDLKETFYDICVNRNLMSAKPVHPAPESNSASSRRLRRRQQPELINLVDSPSLILPGTVNVDSEDEISANNKSANVSFDSENYEVSLKIKWDGKIERFAHRKFQKFSDVIAVLAEKSGADPNHIVLNLDERIIEPDDTPDSIGYRISHFISGRVVKGNLVELFSKKESKQAGSSKQGKPKHDNVINLKVQSDRWKKPLEVHISKDQKMKIVVIKCAEELKCKPEDIKLNFDGDPLPMDSTPADLDLDGGEVLDLRFLKG